jgi:hypothetical protein
VKEADVNSAIQYRGQLPAFALTGLVQRNRRE